LKVVLADLSRNAPRVAYGALSLLDNGSIQGALWHFDGRQPVPALEQPAARSPRVSHQAATSHDGVRDAGACVIVHPAAFDGAPTSTMGRWSKGQGVLEIRLQGWPALELSAIAQPPAAAVYASAVHNPREARVITAVAVQVPREVTPGRPVVLLERSSPLEGRLVRLNAWDRVCSWSVWEPTSLAFVSGRFVQVGESLWRAVSPSTTSPVNLDRRVLSYLWLEPTADGVSRAHMQVSHDFNGDGRIDDDWGHLYTGFAFPDKDGALRAVVLADVSPVGLQGRPHLNPCPGLDGRSLTHSLGLLLYVTSRETVDWSSAFQRTSR
jgi:hypothetical protein